MQEDLQQQQQQLTNRIRPSSDSRARERNALIQTLVTTRQERAGGMVDTKGIGQPFHVERECKQDFGEWSHKTDVHFFCDGRMRRKSQSHAIPTREHTDDPARGLTEPSPNRPNKQQARSRSCRRPEATPASSLRKPAGWCTPAWLSIAGRTT